MHVAKLSVALEIEENTWCDIIQKPKKILDSFDYYSQELISAKGSRSVILVVPTIVEFL